MSASRRAGEGGAAPPRAAAGGETATLTAADSILSRGGGGGKGGGARRRASSSSAPSNPSSRPRLPPPTTLLNLAAAFAAGVCVGEWTRQSRVNRRRRRQDRLLCGVSSLASPGRHVVVVTTAALPWRTGTAVNPALRAAHLAAAGLKVTLLVPWLPPAEQPQVYPPGIVFQTPEEQAEHLVVDAQRRAGLLPPASDASSSSTHPSTPPPAPRFRVAWYRSRYFPALGSILPIDDVTEAVPEEDAAAGCAVVLEEPEHLTWFAHRTRWTSRFSHVVGVMHTNYLSYVAQGLNGGAGGAVAASALYRVNKWVVRLHCHKAIKLSDAVQRLPRQVTCNVHGVASCFLEQGREVAAVAAAAEAAEELDEEAGGGGASKRAPNSSPFSKGAYFLGKAVWGKGWRELLELLDYVQQRESRGRLSAGDDGEGEGGDDAPFDVVDLYGGGEDLAAIEAEASARELRVSFKGPADHSDKALIGPYRVFVNPSTSDVVATTTAEALAMGKWAVVEDLPCNEFFKQFENCLIYRTPDEFAAHLSRALREDPAHMSAEALRALSWEAATERFLRASEIGPLEWPSEAERRYGALLWRMYRSVTGFRLLRQALGLAPESVVEGAHPEEDDAGEESEFERVATLEEADVLFGMGRKFFRSNSGGDGDDEEEKKVVGEGGGRRVSAAGSPCVA